MFEGMSDDEEDFQSVSLTQRCVRQVVQQVKPEVTFLRVCTRGVQPRPPAE